MKNILHAILFTSAFFVSCKRDNMMTSVAKLATTSENIKYKMNDGFIQFKYNPDATIKQVTINSSLATANETTTFDVVYNTDKTIKELTDGDNEKIKAVYKEGLLAIAYIIQKGKNVAYTIYKYESGSLKSLTVYYKEDEGDIPVLKLDFDYNNKGNVVTTTTSFANGNYGNLSNAGVVKMQYDTRENILYAQKDLLALFWHAVSKNNITKQEQL